MKDVRQQETWSRRRFVMALPLLGALPLMGCTGVEMKGTARLGLKLMGTQVDIVAEHVDARLRDVAMAAAFAEMQRLEGLMSRYREESAVRRIGAAAGRHPVPVPPEVMAVLQEAKRVYLDSRGAFDPTVGALSGWQFEPGRQAMPMASDIAGALQRVGGQYLHLDPVAGTAFLEQPGMALDLGGIAKLPILAAGLQVLERAGVDNALVNGGGDVLTMGHMAGRPWRVGVRDPRAPDTLLGILEMEGRGVVASSGDYERGFVVAGRRFHHVLDPRTGWPTTGVQGVTLLARDISQINGWGTALMVQGPAQALAWCRRHAEAELLVAGSVGMVWQSSGMRAMLKPA